MGPGIHISPKRTKVSLDGYRFFSLLPGLLIMTA